MSGFAPKSLNPDAQAFAPKSLNPDAQAFVPVANSSLAQATPTLPATGQAATHGHSNRIDAGPPLCHFGMRCTNPMCTYTHAVDIGMNLRVQQIVSDSAWLERIRSETCAEVIVTDTNMLTLSGSKASVEAAMKQLHGCIPCRFGEKCRDVGCTYCHVAVLAVKGFSNYEFVNEQSNLKAIMDQTKVAVAWDADRGDLQLCGTQNEVAQAKQHLKRLELCRFSDGCTHDACPYWHSIECSLSHPAMQQAPKIVTQLLLDKVAQLPDVEVTRYQGGVTVSGTREAVMTAKNALLPCRYNDKCTNPKCAYLHMKHLPKYDGVRIGLLVGQKGCHIKSIESATEARVHVADVGEEGVWITGSQHAVCCAEKAVRNRMCQSNDCYFGFNCTNRACKHHHPNGRFGRRFR